MRPIAILLLSLVFFAAASPSQTSHPPIPPGIEKLHQADIAATLSRDVDALTALWDDDAALLQPGQPPVIGKAAFRELAKQDVVKSPAAKVLKFAPDFRDIQVVGDVAYEWGYFDASEQRSEIEQPASFRAKFLRIMKRQPDGSWKFTRVMWMPE